MAHDKPPIAIVTGSNKGLGLETCRQLCAHGYHVVVTARDIGRGKRAADDLQRDGCDIMFQQLDISKAHSIERFSGWVAGNLDQIDALVNNAAVAKDGFDTTVAGETLKTNFYGARDLTDLMGPSMKDGANIVMVSSGLGELSCLGATLRKMFASPALTHEQLTDAMDAFVADVEADRCRQAGWPGSAYNVSKVGINALTKVFARELTDRRIKVNAVCPGWVRTDMGGNHAARGVEEGARGIVWAAMLDSDGPTAGFFRDQRKIPW